jgi:bifunctional DNase/RNase
MPKKASRLPLAAFFILILLSFIAIAAINLIDTEDYVVADVLEVSDTTIVLGSNCTAIISNTSPERAQAIQTGIDGVIEERPNTYDIFKETLRSFNITLEYMTLDSYDDGIYYANLFLSSQDKILKLDVKPSDGIALALRTNSTIYINKTLLKELGSNIC